MALKYAVIREGKSKQLRKLADTLVKCPECANSVTIQGVTKYDSEKNLFYNAFFEITVLDEKDGRFEVCCKECNCMFLIKFERDWGI